MDVDFDFFQVEEHSIPAFLELVVKLNETAFRPLFRKLFDWAFTTEGDQYISFVRMQSLTTDSETSNARKVTFCHVYTSLLDYFKVRFLNIYLTFGHSGPLF